MLYLRFEISTHTQELLQALELTHSRLDPYVALPSEYIGELRRHTLAQAVHYSTAIEGNQLSLEQVERALIGEPIRAPKEQIQEVQNYREAIEYVQSLVLNSDGTISEEIIRTIHFLVGKSLPGEYMPGQLRQKQNYIVDRVSGRRVFLPPSAEQVPGLMREFIVWLNNPHDLAPVCVAALAHLNLAAIHPFMDGNGRTARILDSLVLYQSGYKSQELVSLEAYFGRDSQGYYRALAETLGPRYLPDRDVSVWINYYLQAHVSQAQARLELVIELEGEFEGMSRALEREGLTPHQLSMLWLACRWGPLTNRAYRSITSRSRQSIVHDFSVLLEKGLLVRRGGGRSMAYAPSERTRYLYERVRSNLEDRL